MSIADPGVLDRLPSLAAALAEVPDVRHAQGRRHPLLALLLLVCVAMLSGARSQVAIAAWAADHGPVWRRRLGFTHARGPSQATLSRLFQRLDPEELERQLAAWARQAADGAPAGGAAALEGVGLDGKVLRGGRKRDAAGAHLLSALHHRLAIVLGQVGVTEGDELTAAVGLAERVAAPGRVVTVDAGLAHRRLAGAVLAQRADYLMAIKENQPTLLEDLRVLFADPATDARTAATTTAHGGRVEERRLRASAELVGYSAWPGLGQALCLERTVTLKASGRVRREVAYAVTSLPPARATPAQLLRLWREHWHIENKLHWVRDVTFDEDRSGVRAGHAPRVMAACRNAAIGLLRLLGYANIAAATRRLAAQPALALAAVGCPAENA
jgi:predicted transposase YbfD/YdcC